MEPKKGYFCRKIVKPLFLYCFARHIHLKHPNWAMQSQAFLALPKCFSFITARADTAFFSYNDGRHYKLKLGWFSFSTDEQIKMWLRVFHLREAELRLGQGDGGAIGDSGANLHCSWCLHHSGQCSNATPPTWRFLQILLWPFSFWNERYQVIEKSFLGAQ